MRSSASMALDPQPSTANADPGGRLVAVDGRELPLRHTSLAAEAAGGLARVVLTQRFANPYEEPLHVTYQLPLPAEGAVSGFSFLLGDRRVVGEIDRRAAARERFEQALVQGKTAALLEQDRSSLFTQEVGNIPPGEEIVCEVIVDQRLRWLDEGSWEWRFPTVVGPRYLGAQGRVPDADKVRVDVADGELAVRATLALAISDRLADGAAPESPSHPLSIERASRTEVRFRGDASARLDRDVVVRWRVAGAAVGATIESARPSDPAHDGLAFGLLTVVPPEPAVRGKAMPRDLVLLMDVSGSMSGRPFEQCKRVVRALIGTLGPEDRIEMIAFATAPERFAKEPVVATADGKRSALRWLDRVKVGGGTEMHRAVVEALRPLRTGAQRQVVLLTDGFIGFEQEVVREVLTSLPPDARLHTVGVGSAPNRTLTAGASRAGRGTELIVGLEEDAERAAARLLAATAEPIVTELVVDGDAVRGTAPERLPDLFAGRPALVGVAIAPAGGTVRVRGRTAEGAFERTLSVGPLKLAEGNQAIAALYGRERVEDLEMRISAGGNPRDIDAEIERAGLAFQIATRLTSWVAVSEARTVDRPARHERMPHELPHGTSVEGLGLRGAPVAAAAPRESKESGALFQLRELMSLDEEEQTRTQTGVIKMRRFADDQRATGAPAAPPPAQQAGRRPAPTGPGAPPPKHKAAEVEPPPPYGAPVGRPAPMQLEAPKEERPLPLSVDPTAAPMKRRTPLRLYIALLVLALIAALAAWFFLFE